jgi:hypothetical protein
MKYFTIIRKWVVKAESEEEAFQLVSSDPNTYLDSETVSRTEYRKPLKSGASGKAGGWGQAIRDQVLG